MTMDVTATVIADTIVTNLSALANAVSTTSLHETEITTAADLAAVQWTHVGHSALMSAVTLHTAGLAVPANGAAGTMNVIIAVDPID